MWETPFKDRTLIELVDLPAFGRPVQTVWHAHGWRCPDRECLVGSWTGVDPRIALPRLGRQTELDGGDQATGKCGRTVSEVARQVDCDWRAVNNSASAYGEALL